MKVVVRRKGMILWSYILIKASVGVIDMAHELIPRSGKLPAANEVVRLLATEFAYVKADAADGLRLAQERADWIERSPARVFLGHQQEVLECAAKLRTLQPGEALTIKFWDDPSAKRLTMVVLPGESIKFGYASKEDEVSSRELVERCAWALDCEVIMI
ncbi:MAG: hypothetical protein ACMG6S_17865 [Byssovorax sp.]